MSDKSLVIIGHGKMGKAVEQLAVDGGWSVLATFDADWNPAAAKDALKRASVAVEFTEPSAAVGNVRAAVDAGCPIVVGTTGWYDQVDSVGDYVRSAGGAMLWSPNFSLGSFILMGLGRAAGALMGAAGTFDAHIVETHHNMKKDKPSGTAAALAKSIVSTYGRDIPITSIRTGHVPGTHEAIFDSPFEQIRLTHEVRDRRVFAAGALLAADWLRTYKGKPGGVFTMRDVFQSSGVET